MFTALALGPRRGYAKIMQQNFSRNAFRISLLAGVVLVAESAAFAAPPTAIYRVQSRGISDQEHARSQREQGQNRSFEELLRRASDIGRGQYLGVEPDISRNVYRFKFMRPGGNIVWVDIDGRTGRELAVRQ